ncbi:MAG: peptidylprolyl isomerase [Oligoflexia bacterium]|nr:peptidylprolyl isomerase [Oligoflexia bacterium]MBF0364082.1 peptidylprolyl isomerase [Oligoflexia bacterium]
MRLTKSYSKSDYKENIDRIKAILETSMGNFKIELYAKECPETVWNFVNLAEGRQETVKSGPYYDGLTFHRIINGFVIQGGCPFDNGMGGPGYQFIDECNPSLKHDSAGILSMANAGPGTNGSQFFITLAATPHLNGKHTVFGKVIEGMDVVQSIAMVHVDYEDRPKKSITINKVTILRD